MSFYLSLILPLCVLIISAIGAGYVLLYPLQKRGMSINAAILLLLAYFLGQGILSCIFILLGLAGQFHAAALAPIVGAAMIFGSWALYVNAVPVSAAIHREHTQLLGVSLWWYALLPLCFGFLCYGLMGLAGAFDGDSIAFYYVVAKLMNETSILRPTTLYYDFYGITLNADALTAFLMKLKMPELSMRLYPWLNCFFILPMAYAVAVQYGRDRRFALLFLAFICSSTAFVFLQISGNTDLLAVGQGLAALCCLHYALFTASYRRIFFFLAGMTAGFAVCFKTSYVIVLVPWGLALILGSAFWGRSFTENPLVPRQKRWKATTLSLLIVATGMSVALLPHLLKNFVFYGWITPSSSGSLFSPYFSDATTLRLLLSYPLALVYGDYWVQTGNLSSLLLGCLPFLFLVPRRFWSERRQLLLLWGSCLCGLLVWLLILPSVFQLRYMLLCLLLLGIPLLAAAAQHSYTSRLTALMLPVLAACAIWVAYDAAQKTGFIDTARTMIYLKEKRPEAIITDFWKPMREGQLLLNEIAQKDAGVSLMYYRYWLRPDLLQRIRQPTTWEAMKKHNITYIQYDFSSAALLDPLLADIPPWVEVKELFRETFKDGSQYKTIKILQINDGLKKQY